jgi:hypothetical protein
LPYRSPHDACASVGRGQLQFANAEISYGLDCLVAGSLRGHCLATPLRDQHA